MINKNIVNKKNSVLRTRGEKPKDALRRFYLLSQHIYGYQLNARGSSEAVTKPFTPGFTFLNWDDWFFLKDLVSFCGNQNRSSAGFFNPSTHTTLDNSNLSQSSTFVLGLKSTGESNVSFGFFNYDLQKIGKKERRRCGASLLSTSLNISMCLNQDYSLNVLGRGRDLWNVNVFDLIDNSKRYQPFV